MFSSLCGRKSGCSLNVPLGTKEVVMTVNVMIQFNRNEADVKIKEAKKIGFVYDRKFGLVQISNDNNVVIARGNIDESKLAELQTVMGVSSDPQIAPFGPPMP